MFKNFFPENHAVYEIMWKNAVEPERPQTIWRMRFACWISKNIRAQAHAHTRLNYTERISTYFFSQQKLFRERASLFDDAHIACLV